MTDVNVDSSSLPLQEISGQYRLTIFILCHIFTICVHLQLSGSSYKLFSSGSCTVHQTPDPVVQVQGLAVLGQDTLREGGREGGSRAANNFFHLKGRVSNKVTILIGQSKSEAGCHTKVSTA